MGLVLASFRSERCFLHVVLVLISRRASCRRCSATVLCVFLLVVASTGAHIMKVWALTMQGLPLGSVFMDDGAERSFTPCISLAALRLSSCVGAVSPSTKGCQLTGMYPVRAGNVAQLAEYFSSMCKALSLIPSTTCTGHGGACLQS